MSKQGGREGGRASGREGGGGGLARSAGFVAAKGAGLIAIAIIVGVILLQVVDDGTSGPVASAPDDEPKATTTTVVDQETTTTTAPETPARTPDQVQVVVLNTGAATGAAGDLSNALSAAGYVNQVDASDWDIDRPGRTVFCKAGLEREATALAIAAGEGTTSEPFPEPAPPSSEEVDCVVAVGAVA